MPPLGPFVGRVVIAVGDPWGNVIVLSEAPPGRSV